MRVLTTATWFSWSESQLGEKNFSNVNWLKWYFRRNLKFAKYSYLFLANVKTLVDLFPLPKRFCYDSFYTWLFLLSGQIVSFIKTKNVSWAGVENEKKVSFAFVSNQVLPFKLFTRCVGVKTTKTFHFGLCRGFCDPYADLLKSWNTCVAGQPIPPPHPHPPCSLSPRIRPKLKQSSWLCGNQLELHFLVLHLSPLCFLSCTISVCYNCLFIHSHSRKGRVGLLQHEIKI